MKGAIQFCFISTKDHAAHTQTNTNTQFTLNSHQNGQQILFQNSNATANQRLSPAAGLRTPLDASAHIDAQFARHEASLLWRPNDPQGILTRNCKSINASGGLAVDSDPYQYEHIPSWWLGNVDTSPTLNFQVFNNRASKANNKRDGCVGHTMYKRTG